MQNTNVMGIEGFITGNYLTDFNNIDVIDLSADHWNYEFMEEVSINGRMYLGYSDFNIARTTSLPGFLNDNVNFGVLPYPMYDDAQKDVGYRSLQWGGYICIPSYLADEDMAFETVELLSFASDKVNVACYEKLLGKQVADAPQDRQMLDIVWDSVCSDFGLTYSQVIDADFHYMMLHDLTSMSGSKDVASYVSSRINNANKKLSKFTSKVK